MNRILTWCVAVMVSLAAVQQLLGHSTVVMTQRYAQISDEMLRREVERAVSSGRL